MVRETLVPVWEDLFDRCGDKIFHVEASMLYRIMLSRGFLFRHHELVTIPGGDYKARSSLTFPKLYNCRCCIWRTDLVPVNEQITAWVPR